MNIKRSDWLSGKRDEQLVMAKKWNVKTAGNADEWGVPEDIRVRLSAAIDIAERELAIHPSERNAVTNERLKDAFAELTAVMRDIKKRYFYNPPLTNSDIIELGLKIKDSEPTPVGIPLGEATADVKYLGKKVMQLLIKHVEGTPLDEKADYGYKIYFGVYAHGDTMPASGKDLRENKFTRKQKETFTFQPEDSGKIAFFCIRYENSKGETGPWGTLFSAIIP